VTGARRAEIAALQRALAAEHAAVYAYGVAGALLPGEAQREARAAHAGHLARRDRVAARITDAGADPVAPAPVYDLPGPVTDPASARALVTVVEERLAAVWADVVAVPAAAVRELAALVLQETAVRAAIWRGASVAFPGLPERSGT
jgi:uncharacterized protein DUF4439